MTGIVCILTAVPIVVSSLTVKDLPCKLTSLDQTRNIVLKSKNSCETNPVLGTVSAVST